MTGYQLRKIRLAANLTQEGLSQLLFYSVKTIQNWERGKSAIPAGMREQLERMGIDVDTILKNP